MKHAKKLASFLLALVMVFALASTAFAVEGDDTEEAQHTYEIYQIFTGDFSEGVLSNVKWGQNGTGTEKDAVPDTILKELEDVTDSTSDTAKLEVIIQYANLQSTPFKTGTAVKYEDLANGYYLVKDKDDTQDNVENGFYTLYIVQVVDNTLEFTPKGDVPEVKKKVKDTNDSTGETSGWQDSADYDFNDHIPFLLTATLAENVSSYTTYKVVFHDTLSEGLTLDATYGEGENANIVTSGVTVKIDNVDKTASFIITTGTDEDGNSTLTISCDDVKALGAGNSSVITVEYTAKLNENAVVGSAGNPNEVYLEYSNNPNWKADADKGEGPEDSPTGNTPEDTVIVFTYKTIINKVEPTTETISADDYVKLSEDDQKLYTKVDGDDGTVTYTRPTTKPLTGAEFTLEKKLLKTPANEETGAEAEYEWVTIAVEKINNDTTFTFSGLDDGDYRLTETTTPNGYNTIAPIEFTVTANHDVLSDTPALTSISGDVSTGELTFTSNTSEGSLSADVINQKGATLPTTGGMGTTIFYVLGGVLVLVAVVLLVTKKRMSTKG